MQDETRQKLSLQSKLRAAQDDKERLEERVEEEEESKRAMEKQIQDLNQKVHKTQRRVLWLLTLVVYMLIIHNVVDIVKRT